MPLKPPPAKISASIRAYYLQRTKVLCSSQLTDHQPPYLSEYNQVGIVVGVVSVEPLWRKFASKLKSSRC